jgi:peptidoglycan hydrolase-like protein with peptidoglycan-binding domain
MAALILKTGSKGKPVLSLQKFLNQKGKLPKPIEESGEFDGDTKAAVLYFQKKAGLEYESDGAVGPETAQALAKAVGSAASGFAKEFGALAVKGAQASGNQGAGATKTPKLPGKAGKYGNTELDSGAYKFSIPPNPAGKFPLLVLFAGDTKKGVMIAATPESIYKSAIVVFGENNGTFAGFQSALDGFLKAHGASIGAISLCGYSSGGIAAFANYGKATKAVGLIDPNIRARNFDKFDGKTILSINGSTAADWPWSADPGRPGYTIGQARLDSVDLVKKAGGFAEITNQGHGSYPAYFLKKFESKLV